MKKTLVALAAIAATSAFAQSSVTMYGSIDAGYGTTKTTTAGGAANVKTSGLTEGALSGNRLGFRGVEDLGSGLKASFLFEQGITITNNGAGGVFAGYRVGSSGHQNSTAAAPIAGSTAHTGGTGSSTSLARQSYIGLSSANMGEVRVGYQYTIKYMIGTLGGYQAGSEGFAGADVAHLADTGNISGNRANGFTYLSPKFAGGFDAVVQYGSGGTTSSPANFETVTGAAKVSAKRTGFAVNYANGPLKASVGYTSQKNTTGVTATTGTGKLTQLAASYNFGVASVMGTYNNGSSGVPAAAAQVDDVSARQIGVKVPFGAAEFFLTTGKTKNENAAGATLNDIKQNQFGAIYTLSKRTKLYAAAGTTKEGVVAGLSAAAGVKGSSTRFGVNHTF